MQAWRLRISVGPYKGIKENRLSDVHYILKLLDLILYHFLWML